MGEGVGFCDDGDDICQGGEVAHDGYVDGF